MWRMILIGLSTLLFGAIGLYLGLTIHGSAVRALLACVSGAAGGFGIGVIGYDVWRQQQVVKRQVEE